MENKSCLICAWREFCAKKEVIESRYCPDFTLDIAFLKKENENNTDKKGTNDANKRTDTK
ncbi:hypothetical protein [Desulfurella sp.]|uniref:hypothetical protein n=1 Tax=Desulfurella sp. TaxID=1962857 RepID=UPI003D09A730